MTLLLLLLVLVMLRTPFLMLLILMSLFLLFTGSFSASPTCKELFYHIIDDAASDVTVFCLVTVDIDAFGIQFDLHLFLQTATVID